MKPDKLWADLSYKTANLLLSTGYYIGAIPVYWNATANKMEVVTSRSDKLRWIFTVGFMMFWKVAMVIAFVLHVRLNGFNTQSVLDIWQCLLSGLSIFLAFFDLHTAWQVDEFVSFINKSAGYFEYFQNKFSKPEITKSKEDLQCGILKICFFIGSVALSIGSGLLYLFRCDFHFLILIFGSSVCGNASPLSMAIAFCFQVYFTAILCFSMVIYVDLFTGVIIIGIYYVMNEMIISNPNSRTTSLLHEDSHWNHAYRCSQLTVGHVNQCIRATFVPILFLLSISLSVVLIYILIRIDAGVTLQLLNITLLGLIAIFFLVLVKGSCTASSISQAALESRNLVLKTKYLEKYHKSLPILKAHAGIFFDLDRDTVPAIFAVIVDYTVNLLLL